jgi:hypothetical protein
MSHRFALSILALPILSACGFAQGVNPYPSAITDREFYAQSPMTPPAVDSVFQDPDLGGTIVRVTGPNTNPALVNGYFRNPEPDVNEWSLEDSKFYVVGYNAFNLAFAFDPSTMTVSPLPGAGSGGALIVPLRQGPSFSFVDSDLMYGTAVTQPLVITTYRFSTGQTTPFFDMTTCGTTPPLVAGPNQSSSDTTLSNDDGRIVISAGGNSIGKRPFVIVYDQQLGCRWYNTQTGQIGGQWGPTGQATTPDTFSVNSSQISGDGQSIRIGVAQTGFYVWDLNSLTVNACNFKTGDHCSGYGAVGFSTYANAPDVKDEMNTFLRPLENLTDITQLINPLPKPYYKGMEKSFAWSNGRWSDANPVCGTTYSPTGNPNVAQPYDDEVFCVETDGLASTIWRFGHHRGVWQSKFYWTLPFSNMSLDGNFLAFTSSWDDQLGIDPDGNPRTDMFIVHLQ